LAAQLPQLLAGAHINNICGKANRTIGFLKRNLNIASTKLKSKAYLSLVRPQVEYAATIWDPYIQKDIDKLEMVQRRGARYVTNNYGRTESVTAMLNHLDWPRLDQRRKMSRLGLIYKINRNLVSIDSETRLEASGRTSRNSHVLAYNVPSCKTDTRLNSFFPRTIRDWNKLPTDTVTASSLAVLKHKLSLIDN
jgi:hypothetical protein